MDSLFKKLMVISGLGIFLFITVVCINIVVAPNSGQTLKLFADAHAADIKTADEQSLPAPSDLPKFSRRLDVYDFIVGVLLTSLGQIAIFLVCLRRNRKDLLLLSFGAFCLQKAHLTMT